MAILWHYILSDTGEPTPCDQDTWIQWMQEHDRDRVVARTEIGPVVVSTVFLACNHALAEGPPILYETMVFGGALDEHHWRYTTRAEAVLGHDHVCALVHESAPACFPARARDR